MSDSKMEISYKEKSFPGLKVSSSTVNHTQKAGTQRSQRDKL